MTYQLIRKIVEDNMHLNGALLPILHEINNSFGFVSNQAIGIISEVLNITKAEIDGVVSFYEDFKNEPNEKNKLKVCCSEACQSRGSINLYNHFKNLSKENQNYIVEPVYCLGNCSMTPSVMYNGKVYGRCSITFIQDKLNDI